MSKHTQHQNQHQTQNQGQNAPLEVQEEPRQEASLGAPVAVSRGAEVEKKQRILKKEALINTQENTLSVSLSLPDGASRIFSIPSAMFLQFAAHGALQKFGDTFTNALKANEGDVEAAAKVLDTLNAAIQRHEWSVSRSEMVTSRTSDIARAVAEVKSIDIEKATKFVAGLQPEQLKFITGSKQFAPILARYKLERQIEKAPQGDDKLDDLMKELN